MKRYLPHVGLSVFFSVVGVLVGVSASPNYMRVHVDPVGKLNLAPKNGDVIQFDGINDDWNQYDIAINFGNSSPCSPTQPLQNGLCVVAYPNPAGTYLYTCKTSLGGVPVACDPNMGPASTTGGKGGGSTSPGKGKLLWWSTLGKFKIWSTSFTGGSPMFSHTTSPTLGEASAPGVAGAMPKSYNGVQAQVSCDGNNVTQVDTIQVNAGGKIVWGSDLGPTGFTLTVPKAVCKDGINTKGQVCPVVGGTSGSPYTYSATYNRCGANDKLQIQVN